MLVLQLEHPTLLPQHGTGAVTGVAAASPGVTAVPPGIALQLQQAGQWQGGVLESWGRDRVSSGFFILQSQSVKI